MSTANVRKFPIFIPLDVLNSQHGCFIRNKKRELDKYSHLLSNSRQINKIFYSASESYP